MSGGDHPQCILGLDLGTTSVKCVVVDRQNFQILAKQSKDTQAGEGGQQDVTKIISALQNCVGRFPRELLRNVTAVGICGQMHGIVFWKQEGCWSSVSHGGIERFEVARANISPLVTWQDSTCSPEFLKGLPKPDSHLRIAAGYGCATLFWKQQNEPQVLKLFDRAATVQDFVVALLCNLAKPVMSVQNAASWGYFDTEKMTWNLDILESTDFPVEFLPQKILKPGAVAGHLSKSWYGIPEGVRVLAALGDMQCSVLSTLFSESESTAVLNVSTSAQLSLIMPPEFKPAVIEIGEAIEYFPYFQGRYLAVAASLNGGNVMAAFVRMLQSWLGDLGCGIPQAAIWERVLALAQQAPVTNESEEPLVIKPTLFGERHLPGSAAAAAAHNISPSNLSLGQVARSVYAGLVANLHSMLSCETLTKYGATGMVGTGSALSRNPALQHQVSVQYAGLSFRMVQQGDAAYGAALAAATLIDSP